MSEDMKTGIFFLLARKNLFNHSNQMSGCLVVTLWGNVGKQTGCFNEVTCCCCSRTVFIFFLVLQIDSKKW